MILTVPLLVHVILIDHVALGLPSVDTFRALIAAGGRMPIGETLDIALGETDGRRVAFVGTPGPRSYNPWLLEISPSWLTSLTTSI